MLCKLFVKMNSVVEKELIRKQMTLDAYFLNDLVRLVIF